MIVAVVDVSGNDCDIDLREVETIYTGSIRNRTQSENHSLLCHVENTVVEMKSGKAIVLDPQMAYSVISPFVDVMRFPGDQSSANSSI